MSDENDQKYTNAEFDAMDENKVYAIAKKLRVPGCASMGESELRARTAEMLRAAGQLPPAGENDAAPSPQAGGQAPRPAAPRPVATPMATVRYGSHNAQLPVVGKTIAAIRRELTPSWNIDVGAAVYVNGQTPSPDHVVATEETVEFIRPAGQKG